MYSARSLLVSVLFVAVCAPLPAQLYGDGHDGALAPTADLTLDTSANGGVFQFTSIHIPQGVTVRLTGSNPAQLLCRGAVDIAGSLDASAPGSVWTYAPIWGYVVSAISSSQPGPGGYAGGGFLQPGFGPGGGSLGTCQYPGIAGGPASHATTASPGMCYVQPPVYGASLPFDLRGGSGGAGSGPVASQGDIGPPASGGGGVIVLLAGGPITVTGSISARGGDIAYVNASRFPVGVGGLGSGGTILLRSLGCVRISGRIDTLGGASLPLNNGGAGNGFIRIDSYSACGAPDVTGAVIQPTPYLTAMPWLTALEPARIGQTYRVRCASAPGDVLGLYLSFGRSSLSVPPFGVVELDPTLILDLGQFSVPVTGHDPLAAADIAMPNVPAIIGLRAYSQMFNAFNAVNGQPRLSNVLTTIIGG
jgi:hypothetical protein